MAETENRGSKESFRRGQGGRKRREPPFIDATATELPTDAPGPGQNADPSRAWLEPDPLDDAATPSGERPGDAQTEPVLFGAAVRNASPSPEERGDDPAATGPSPAGEPAAETTSASDIPDDLAPAAPDGGTSTAAPEPRSRRSFFVPALLGLLVLLTLGAVAGLYFWDRGRSKELSSAIAEVQGRLATLEQRPDPAAKANGDVAALGRRTDALDSASTSLNEQLTSLKGAVADLQSRVAEIASKADANAAKLSSAVEPPTPAAASPSPPTDEVVALTGKLDELSRRVDALQNRPEPDRPAQVPVDLGPIEGRLAALDARSNDLGRRVEALAASVAALPKPDLAPLRASLAGVERRLGPIEAALAAPKAPDRVTEARAEGSAEDARAAPVAVVAQALSQAIAEGRPFGQELDALRALGVDDASLAPLAPLAAKGAPTVDALSAQWSGVKDDVVAALRPKGSGSVLDRFAAGARNLVQVRRVDAPSAEDPGAITSRIDAAVQHGDLRDALAEREKLPEAGRSASQGWADAVQARLDAETAARALVSRAIATLARAKG